MSRPTPSRLPRFESERLILRPVEPTDAPVIQRLAGSRAIADTTLTIPHPYEDGMAEAWIASHHRSFVDGTGVHFAIARKVDDALVGIVSLGDIEAGHQAELGYWIAETYWGRGYCTEAAAVVIAYAFATLGLARVYSNHFTRNPASGRVMQKLGMRHEGCRRRHARKWDGFEDLELYGILAAEWSGVTVTAQTTQ